MSLFNFLRLMSKISSLFRNLFYNFLFRTKFNYFGENVTVDILGKVKVGKNVYIGNNATIIVEKNAKLIIGDNGFIGENCYIKCFGGEVCIGNDVSLNSKSYLNGCGGIMIGDNTRVGTQSIIIASNHNFENKSILIKDQGINKKGIIIGSNIWLGARVTILDGVEIPNDCVIGACSLVAKKIYEKGVYVGVPVKKIK